VESNSVFCQCQQNHTVTAQQESNLFITSTITDWIGRQKVLLAINPKNYNFQEKENSKQVKKERENLY